MALYTVTPDGKWSVCAACKKALPSGLVARSKQWCITRLSMPASCWQPSRFPCCSCRLLTPQLSCSPGCLVSRLAGCSLRKAEAVGRVLQHAAERGPTSLQVQGGGLLRDQLLSLVPVDAPLPPQISTASTRVYLAGQVQLRARDCVAAALLTSATGCAQLGSCLKATTKP
jgi:hypothetical protein